METSTNYLFYFRSRNIGLIILLLLSFLKIEVKAQSLADLSLTKTVDNTIANVGDLVTFKIVVKNNGPSVATNVRVTDVLASGFTFVSASPSISTWSNPIWNIGNLAVNQTETMTLVASVNPFGNYTNTAAIKAEEPDPNLNDNFFKTTIGVIRAIDDFGYINATTGGEVLANVVANDFLHGAFAKIQDVVLLQLSSTSPQVQLDVTTGKVTVQPNTAIGNYKIVYKITDKNNPALSSTGTININVNNGNSAGGNLIRIEAKPDHGNINSLLGGIAVVNVLANDILSDGKADFSNVDLEMVSSQHPNLSLNVSNGSVFLLANTPKGVYTLIYKITDKADPSVTALGNVIVTVVDEVGLLQAEDDYGTIDGATGGVAIPNVLWNDLLDGKMATVATVTISKLYSSNPAMIDINVNTGEVTAAPGTPNGVYTLTYQIVDKANINGFAVADAIVNVTGGMSVITANPDSGTVNGTEGGIAVLNVLANDDLLGAIPLLSQVNISQTFSNSGGVNLDFTTGSVIVNPGTPNGYYTLAYLIEDKNNPGVSSWADVDVHVSGGISLITAIEDAGSINGDIGGVAVANILANDVFKGKTPLITEVNIKQTFSNNPNIYLDEATGTVIVNPGTENGVYTLAYYIEDKIDSDNFSYADIIVSVVQGSGYILAKPDNGIANGTIGGIAVPNVLANDDLDGKVPLITEVNLTQVSTTHPGVTLDENSGQVLVATGTPVGTYKLVYQIEDKANPGKTSQTDVTVTVTRTSLITAVNDNGKINRITGGVAVANVLANDDLEGAVPLLAQVNIKQTYTENPNINLDPLTGSIIVVPGAVPVGFYTVTYEIEDKANPGSIAKADAIIEVTNDVLPLIAVNDFGIINGVVGGVVIPNILSNDKLNGLPVTTANVDIILEYNPEPKITLNLNTGEVAVSPNTPPGVYTLIYTIKDKSDPLNTSSAYIEVTVTNNGILAKDDKGNADGDIGGVAVGNVLTNDILNNKAPLITEVNLTQVSSNHPGVNLNPATGAVSVAAGTPAGIYTVVYQIEDKSKPGTISRANVVVTVTKTALITANDDHGVVNRIAGGIAVANVLANDDLKGSVPLLAQVNIIQTFTENPNINLDPLTGSVKVMPGVVPVGFYTVTYQIEDKANPGTTALADVIVEVTDNVLPLIANNDKGAIDGLTGGVVIPNILVNDTFNGSPVAKPGIDILLDYNPEPKITLNLNTGEVSAAPNTPAGVYTLVYTIKDKSNPANISSAYIEVTVTGKTLIANDDQGTVNGLLGGTVVPDVLINDTLNGNPVTLPEVTLTQVSTTHSGITLDPLTGKIVVAPGTPAGVFKLVYKIVDKTNPANFDEATVLVTVTNPNIAALDDAGTVSAVLGGEAVANILNNDTFKGTTAKLADVTIQQISTTHPDVKVDPVTGKAIVTAGTTPGVYTIVYSITDKTNPANAAIANVVVTVVNKAIMALDDQGKVYRTIGGVAVNDILVNDLLNNLPAKLADVNISQISTTHPNVTVDPTTGKANVVAGTPVGAYTIVYRITDKSNSNNYAEANVFISVLESDINPENDEATIDGLTDVIAIPNILANDKVNGQQATFTNVVINNVVGMVPNAAIIVNPVTGEVSVKAGIAPGVYTYTYQISELNNPANTKTAEIRITVTGLTKIGLAKTVSAPKPEADGSYNLTYTIAAKNFGSNTLTHVSIIDDLKLTFPAPLTFTVIGTPVISGDLVANPGFNGDNQIELLRNTSTLLAGAEATVSFLVNVKLNKASGTYLNTAIAYAEDLVGNTATAESTNGVIPDPDLKMATPVELKPVTVYIPEGFSPNNDGVNDKFVIKSTAGDQISLEVFNRWGSIVYKNTDYKNEWDGRSNQGIKIGEDLPDGTYFYTVIINGKDRFVRYITIKR